MYKLTEGTSIRRLIDGAIIPNDPQNPDFRAYQAWVALGNTPQAYVPPTPDPRQVELAAARQAIRDVNGTWDSLTAVQKQTLVLRVVRAQVMCGT